MIDNPCQVSGDMDDALRSSGEAIRLELTAVQLRRACRRQHGHGSLPCAEAMQCPQCCYADTLSRYHTNEDADGLPQQIWLDRRDEDEHSRSRKRNL